MTTDELNAIVQAVMLELEKAGVDFDFKAETPQADDLVYVMRGTADRYMGITVKWQNLLDIIVQKATEAKNEAVSAKDIALQTLATIQSIESNISTMKASVETTKSQVETMKASVEASESNVTQMKSDVSTMKASVEGTKTEVEGIKEETAGLLNTKADKTYVDGELAKKVNYTDSLTYKEIMEIAGLTNKVASAEALKTLGDSSYCEHVVTENSGEYWRFASGLQICLLKKSLGNPTFNSWGSIYSCQIPSIDFPVPFVSVPYEIAVATSIGSWGGFGGEIRPNATSWTGLSIFRATQSSYGVDVILIAIGRWK